MKFDRFGKMIPYGQDPQERPDELNYSAHISGPYCAGIYYGRGKNRAEHDNHRLSQLLYRNKQFKFPKDPLTKEEIEEICELMVSELIRNHGHGNIVIPIPNMEPETIKSQMKCAFPIAAGFAPILHLNFYDDVLVRVRRTEHDNTKDAREEAASKNYDVSEYIKTAENSTIKDASVILIDDIRTSGSTTNVCANLLMHYGARHVTILCAAQTKASWE